MLDTSSGLPAEIAERIGPYYVYLLVDPSTGVPFYVGKGTGDRLLTHGLDAFNVIHEGAKVHRIREIRGSGREPQVDVVRHGLTEAEAFHVEAALIDCLGGLTNVIRGTNADAGRIALAELVAQYGAEPLAYNADPALLIRISRWQYEDDDAGIPGRLGFGYRPGISKLDLYNSTRVWWRISQGTVSRRGITHAVAVHAGVTRALYEIDKWVHDSGRGRWGFEGTLVESGPLHDAYIGRFGKRVPFKRGHQSPIAYWPPKADDPDE